MHTIDERVYDNRNNSTYVDEDDTTPRKRAVSTLPRSRPSHDRSCVQLIRGLQQHFDLPAPSEVGATILLPLLRNERS